MELAYQETNKSGKRKKPKRGIISRMAAPLFAGVLALESVFVGCYDTRSIAHEKAVRLVKELRKEDFERKRRAALELVRIGKPALPVLKKALNNKNSDVQIWAAWVLGRTRDPSAVNALAKVLSHENVYVRRECADALVRIGGPAVPALVHVLRKGNKYARVEAAMALGEIKGAAARDALRYALKDVDADVRLNAAKGLEKIKEADYEPAIMKTLKKIENKDVRDRLVDILLKGGRLDIPSLKTVLAKALRDKNAEIRRECREALVRIGGPAVPALVHVLRKGNKYARVEAAMALGEIKGAAARDALRYALKDVDADVRLNAAKGLESRKDVSIWVKALDSEYKDIRKKAATVLARTRDSFVADALVERLKKECDWRVRRKIADALKKIGEPALPSLRSALRDSKPHVRTEAAYILGGMKDVSSISELAKLLNDKEERVRYQAVIALGEFKSPSAAKALRKALLDRSKDVRLRAAEELAATKDKSAILVLRRLVKDKNENLRYNAADVLGKFRSPSAVRVLRTVLRDKSEDVRRNAFEALENNGKLSTYVWIGALNSNYRDVRERAAVVLGNLKATSAIVPLISRLRREKVHGVRYQIKGALEEIGKPAVPFLRRALRDRKWQVRLAVAAALGEIGATSAVNDLARTLRYDRNKHVRHRAAWALGIIGNTKAVPALTKALEDKDEWVRDEAVESLETIGKPAVPVLTKALNNKDPSVRQKAANALKKLLKKNPEKRDIPRS